MIDDPGPFGQLIIGLYEYACATQHVVIRHTHVHKGQTWNILVDSRAKAAAVDVMAMPPPQMWYNIMPTQADVWA